MDFLCASLQYFLLRGSWNSMTVSSSFHLEQALRPVEGKDLKNTSCGQWLTPVQRTTWQRGGNGDPAQGGYSREEGAEGDRLRSLGEGVSA